MVSRPFTNLFSRVRNAPLMGEFLIFAFSTVLLQFSRFGVNLYTARLLGPETWGLWNILNLTLAYSGLLHLGTINAMNRDVPIFRGKGDVDRVSLIQSVTLGVVLISAVIVGAGLWIGSTVFADEALSGPLVSLSLLLAVSLFFIFLQTYLKSNSQFHKMSYQQLVFAGLFPLIALPLAYFFGLPGFIGGQAITVGLVAIGMVSIWKFNLKPIFNKEETLRLMRIGFPILLVGILYILLTTADRLVIIALLDVKQLGYYSLSIMVVGIIGLIPMLVAQQMYPRMAEAWGRSGSVQEVLKWVYRQTVMAAGITLPIVVVIYLAAPPFIMHFLPDYAPGITAVKIIVVGPFFLALSAGFGNLLNTLNKQVYYLFVQAFALLLNVTLNILLVRAGLGITGVALGTTSTYTVYSIILVVVGLTIARKDDSYFSRPGS